MPRTLSVFAAPILTTLILALGTTWAWSTHVSESGMYRLAVPLLGYLLSIGMGVVVHLLFGRMVMYRAERDQAVTEVEERKAAQRALRVAESRYHRVFDSATDGLLVLGDDGLIQEANSRACYMSGYEAGELVGRSLGEIFNSGVGIEILDDFLRQVRSFGAAQLEATV